MKPLKKMRRKLLDAQYYFQFLPNVECTNFVKTVSAKKLSLVIKKYSLITLKNQLIYLAGKLDILLVAIKTDDSPLS